MRYYVYSLEAGYPPYSPITEDDDLEKCKSKCVEFSIKYDVNCYVVDRLRVGLMQEIFMRKSSSFTKVYEDTREQIRKLKQ